MIQISRSLRRHIAVKFLLICVSVDAQTQVSNVRYEPDRTYSVVGPASISAANVSANPDSTTVYTAVKKITLGPVFRVSQGAEFHARIITDFSAPSAPTNLDISGSSGGLRLAWIAGLDDVGIAGSEIWRRVKNTGSYSKIAEVSGALSSYLDYTADSQVTYDYFIRSFDAENRTADSAVASAMLNLAGGDDKDADGVPDSGPVGRFVEVLPVF